MKIVQASTIISLEFPLHFHSARRKKRTEVDPITHEIAFPTLMGLCCCGMFFVQLYSGDGGYLQRNGLSLLYPAWPLHIINPIKSSETINGQ